MKLAVVPAKSSYFCYVNQPRRLRCSAPVPPRESIALLPVCPNDASESGAFVFPVAGDESLQ